MKMDNQDVYTGKSIYLLLPILILGIITIFFRIYHPWFLAVEILSLVAYLSVITYYYVKQKAYKQLVRQWIGAIISGIFLYFILTIP